MSEGEVTKPPIAGKYYEGRNIISGWDLSRYGPWEYMGKYLDLKLTGASHDPDPVYIFEGGKSVQGLFWQFREVAEVKTDEKAATDKVDK
jgi:hypothetical protein